MIQKMVILSGATGGLGREIIKVCLERELQNTQLIALYRNEEKMLQICNELGAEDQFVKLKHDFSEGNMDFSKIENIIQQQNIQEVTFVHSAYALIKLSNIGSMESDYIKSNVSTNVLGFTIFINELVQLCNSYKIQLNVVNIDSGAAYRPLKGWSLYSAGKAYINLFLRTLILEHKNVHAVTYEPGVIDTPMQEVIRNTDKRVFGQVEVFCEYYEKNKLNSPEIIAFDIYNRFIEKWTKTDFQTGIKECNM